MKKKGIKILISLALFILAMAIKFENVWINNSILLLDLKY